MFLVLPFRSLLVVFFVVQLNWAIFIGFEPVQSNGEMDADKIIILATMTGNRSVKGDESTSTISSEG